MRRCETTIPLGVHAHLQAVVSYHVIDHNCISTGCSGALAREMAKAYPSSSVTVFDLPQVVEAAQKHFSQENDTIVFEMGETRSAVE